MRSPTAVFMEEESLKHEGKASVQLCKCTFRSVTASMIHDVQGRANYDFFNLKPIKVLEPAQYNNTPHGCT